MSPSVERALDFGLVSRPLHCLHVRFAYLNPPPIEPRRQLVTRGGGASSTQDVGLRMILDPRPLQDRCAHMYPTYRGWLPGLFALVVASAVPGFAQQSAIRRDHFSIDIGLLQGGFSYARRIGHGRFSVGGGVWGAWEPWDSFDGSMFQPIGVEAFARMHPSREVHVELGPSLLRYHWADDCSACTGTFAGVRAMAMMGTGVFSLGPSVRLGRTTGNPEGSETGILWGIQLRLLFSWGS
jgi:hypothetical protein